MEKAISEQVQIREGHMKETHFADELRNELRKLNTVLSNEEQVLSDLRERIEEQKTLKAEILTMKFKLAKATTASLFLSGVEFEFCPLCGMKMGSLGRSEKGTCPLCKSVKMELEESKFDQAELVRKDLTARLDDITESIERHERALKKQERRVKQIGEEKAILDNRLSEELKNYDSAFLSRSREIDRQVATIKERIRGLEKISQMVKSIDKLGDSKLVTNDFEHFQNRTRGELYRQLRLEVHCAGTFYTLDSCASCSNC